MIIHQMTFELFLPITWYWEQVAQVNQMAHRTLVDNLVFVDPDEALLYRTIYTKRSSFYEPTSQYGDWNILMKLLISVDLGVYYHHS